MKKYIELLRIVCILSVITIHVLCIAIEDNAYNFYTIDGHVIYLLNNVLHYAVPIFVMISGVVFLNKNRDLSIKEMYKKYIKRIALNILIWGSVYSIVLFIINGENIKFIITNTLFYQNNHIWYLYMIIGLYMIFPLLKKMLDSCTKSEIEYIILLWIIFQFILPEVIQFQFLDNFTKMYERFHFTFPMGYIGYAILGMYLDKFYITLRTQNRLKQFIIIILPFLCFGINYILIRYKIDNGILNIKESINNFSIFILLISIYIFILVKNNYNKIHEKVDKIICAFSKYTYGIYLSHYIIIILVSKFKVNNYFNSTLLMIVIVDIIVIVLSTLITHLLKLNKKIEKYLV